MNLAAIYHRTDENYCYPLDEDRILIALKTGYDVDKVVLYYGDPFSHGIAGGNQNWTGEALEINQYESLKYHKLWKAVVKPEFKRCKYYFKIYSGEEVICMMEDDFYSQEHMEHTGATGQYFMFPWLNSSDVIKTPAWVKDTVWYQIFPERFANGNPKRNKSCVKPWKSEPVKYDDWYGGDIEGIIEKLPYLSNLGISGIYLNPIFLAGSNHKYETTDYEVVDPGFGDDEVLRKLVDTAHSMGIKIMLDGVFNHCGFKNPIWLDVVKKGPQSKYYKWFFINKWPFDTKDWFTRDGRFYSFAFFGSMPKLNTNNIEVVDYLTKVCKGWISKYDIDGIRFDVGNEVSHSFLKHLNRELKAINPDFYLMGEIWHDSEMWLKGDEYDAVMNYPLVNSVTAFWTNKEFSNKDFEYAVNRCYNLYTKQQMEAAFNLFDSHDTDRIMNRVNGNIDALYQQMIILFTMAGSPCIYYGTEVGLEGGHDPDCRRCMPWEEIAEGKYNDRISFFSTLINLRKNTPAFKSMGIKYLYDIDNEKVLHYEKEDNDGHKYEIILNCSNEAITYDISEEILISNKYDNGIIFPFGVVIYEKI